MPMERFLRFLKRSPREAVFNPWRQHDEENDIGPRAPGIRRALGSSAYVRHPASAGAAIFRRQIAAVVRT